MSKHISKYMNQSLCRLRFNQALLHVSPESVNTFFKHYYLKCCNRQKIIHKIPEILSFHLKTKWGIRNESSGISDFYLAFFLPHMWWLFLWISKMELSDIEFPHSRCSVSLASLSQPPASVSEIELQPTLKCSSLEFCDLSLEPVVWFILQLVYCRKFLCQICLLPPISHPS